MAILITYFNYYKNQMIFLSKNHAI